MSAEQNISIPLDVAILIRNAFLPLNPRRCRTADPEVVVAALRFIELVELAQKEQRDGQ